MIGLIPVILLTAALVLAPVIGGGLGEFSNGIVQILVFAAVCAHALGGRRDGRRWPSVPGAIALGVFLLAVLVSVFASKCLYLSLVQVLMILSWVGAFWLAADLARDIKYATIMAAGLALSGLWVCTQGIRDYAISQGGGAKFWAAVLSPGDHFRLSATFLNPNFFAGFLVIAIPVSLALYLSASRATVASLFGVAFVVEVSSLAMTGSKFGVIAAIIALIIAGTLAISTKCLGKRHLVRLLIIALIAAPLLVVFSGTIKSRMQEASAAGGSQAHSQSFRLYTWIGATRMIKANPVLGVGPGMFSVVFPRYALAGYTTHAHESYLQIAAESGIPALIAFLVVLGSIGAAGFVGIVKRHETKTNDSPAAALEDFISSKSWRMIVCALFGACVGSVVRNLVDSDWYYLGVALPFWIASGLVIGRTGGAERRLHSGGFKMVIVVVCIAAIFACAVFGFGDYLALANTQQGLERAVAVSPLNPKYHSDLSKYLAVNGTPEEALKQADEAIRLSPADGGYYFAKALVAERAGKLDLALSALNESLEYKPHSAQVLFEIARVYLTMGNLSGYEAYTKRMLAQEHSVYETLVGVPEMVDTRFARAHYYFAYKFMSSGKYQDAAREFQAAIEVLERWQSYPNFIEIARFSGQLSPDDEKVLLGILKDSKAKLKQIEDRSK